MKELLKTLSGQVIVAAFFFGVIGLAFTMLNFRHAVWLIVGLFFLVLAIIYWPRKR